MHFIGELIIILITTTLLGQLFARFNMPSVIGQLLSGIILGPAILAIVRPSNIISIFSELGAILLMFLAGLESDLDLLKKYFKLSFTVAAIGVLLPVIFISGAVLLFHIKFWEAVFIGIIFAATSVSISVEVLKDSNKLQSRAGVAILGAAVVDDILAVIVLSLFTTFKHEGSRSLTGNFYLDLLIQIIFFGFIWLVHKYIAPVFMKIAQKLAVNYSVIIASFALALSLAWLADLANLSGVVGAFFGGLAIRQTPQFKELTSSVSVIGYSVFIPVFFADIGLSMTFANLWNNLGFILVLTVLAVLSKYWSGQLSAKAFGFSKTEASIVGAGMISRGEVALIIAQIGISHHLFPKNIYASIIIVIIVVTILSPFILNYFIKKES